MSSHPPGLRFSSFSATSQTAGTIGTQGASQSSIGNSIVTKNMQPQPQQGTNNNNSINNNNNNINNNQITNNSKKQTKHQFTTTTSLSDSETDLSTSTENLSMEQRYVLRHTPRVEPQGQENLQENTIGNNEQQRFSSNASTDSTRYASSNRSLSEARNPIFVTQQGNGNNTPNRNSLKEVNSNRSSMDVSTCSYNTLIIHNDDSMYSIANREYPSPPPIAKKERPRSYGEQGMQEITEIPDDYLNQSHVLKHLAKEMKNPAKGRTSNTRDSGVSENTDSKDQKFDWIIEEGGGGIESPNKSKSKSQPDLTKLGTTEAETLEALAKENATLKQQLLMCCMKVAKTQKLEDEVTNIYRVYEELVQSCERREKLERVARMRLQENLQKVQALNRALKDQVDIFQTQLLTPSEHQILIAQLFTQNKELCAAKERQDIELAAQQATLQEQRTHIGILDTALNNAQRNIRRMEEELRKKQIYIERLTQLHGAQAKQNERKMRLDYEAELSKDSNRSGSSTNSDSKWQLQEKNSQIMRLESEQRALEEHAMRQNASKLSLEKTSQETDRIIAEAKHDKLRYLEEVHSAQRKVGDLQAHLKGLESRLAEKDALIRALQNQKICGSSFDSYNLSTDSFALNPLRYNSPSSFNASNTSFNTNTNASLLEQAYAAGNTTNFNSSPTTTISGALVAAAAAAAASNYGQTPTPIQSYNQSVVNLQSISGMPGSYSPNSSNYSASYDPNAAYMVQNSPTFNTTTSSAYDEHMKKQIDEQLSKFETLQRGLCCFPSLSNKKPNQPLLSDEVSVLSTNNSDAFLQKLAHLDQRERDRQEQEAQVNKSKTEEIVLLEKQGRCSQKIRNNASGNLAQVTQTVGQNMTDISNIGNTLPQGINSLALPPRKERGNSLPPSALPRPPRSLKPPRKIDYDRLSDTEIKKRSQTPPKLSPQRTYEMKTSSLKRDFHQSREYSPANHHHHHHHHHQQHANFSPMKEISFNKRKDYGTMSPTTPTTPSDSTTEATKFGFKTTPTEFSKPDFTSTKKYHRLEDSPKLLRSGQGNHGGGGGGRPDLSGTSQNVPDSNSLKRSFLPSSRTKMNVLTPPSNKNLRDSFNSNGSNNSRKSPMHLKSDSNASQSQHLTLRLHSKTPPKFIQYGSTTSSPTGGGGQLSPTTATPTGVNNDDPNNNTGLTGNRNGGGMGGGGAGGHPSRLQAPQMKSSLPIPNSPPPTTALPPTSRKHLCRNGENRYRIQF